METIREHLKNISLLELQELLKNQEQETREKYEKRIAGGDEKEIRLAVHDLVRVDKKITTKDGLDVLRYLMTSELNEINGIEKAIEEMKKEPKRETVQQAIEKIGEIKKMDIDVYRNFEDGIKLYELYYMSEAMQGLNDVYKKKGWEIKDSEKDILKARVVYEGKETLSPSEFHKMINEENKLRRKEGMVLVSDSDNRSAIANGQIPPRVFLEANGLVVEPYKNIKLENASDILSDQDSRYIVEYLIKEKLADRPEDVREKYETALRESDENNLGEVLKHLRWEDGVLSEEEKNEIDRIIENHGNLELDSLPDDLKGVIEEKRREHLQKDEKKEIEKNETESRRESMKVDEKETYPEKVTREMIEMLEKGTAPWIKPWEKNELMCQHNPVTGTVYRGWNALYLDTIGSARGYSDPRWMTFKQIQDYNEKNHPDYNDPQRLQLQKGSKAVTIAFYQPPKGVTVTDDETGEEKTAFPKGTRPIYKYYNVFNASQITNMPALDREKIKREFEPIERCENILDKSNAVIMHDQGDRAFYSPSRDEIHLPEKESFKDNGYYYATAMHELGHWTGHETRCKREIENVKGSPKYAREELVAELYSYMMAQETGIPHDPTQHASYVQSWVSILKEHNTEIIKASNEANRAMNYVLGMENPERSLVMKPEPEKVLSRGGMER